jgi:hypothetical protein
VTVSAPTAGWEKFALLVALYLENGVKTANKLVIVLMAEIVIHRMEHANGLSFFSSINFESVSNFFLLTANMDIWEPNVKLDVRSEDMALIARENVSV